MILYGPNINAEEGSFSKGQAALTIAQLVQYNTYFRRREGDVKKERRNKSRESPVLIYVGVSVHAKTCCRDLVEILHKFGISISYDRVLSISTDLGNEVCRRYWQQAAVCPSNLRLGLFTTDAVDNILIRAQQHQKTPSTAQAFLCCSIHRQLRLVLNKHRSISQQMLIARNR